MPKEQSYLGTPLRNPAEDEFNRASFGKSLAARLAAMGSTDGAAVVGLYGQWGSGKSTILNFVSSYLTNDFAGHVSVATFNPWFYSGHDDLRRGFFDVLARQLSIDEKLADGLASHLSSHQGPLGKIPVSGLSSIRFATDRGSPLQVPKADETLSAALARSDRTLIILIDDVDRLDQDEVLLVLKLVRMNASLPRIVYLLAFDDEVVANTIGTAHGTRQEFGRGFLEKIIQFQLSIPAAGHTRLLEYVERQARQAVWRANLRLSEADWQEFKELNELLAYRLTTPRQATRLAAALEFALPMLAGEVDTLQQMAIEGLRILYAELYPILRLDVGRTGVRGASLADAAQRAGMSELEKNGAERLFEYLRTGVRRGATIRASFSNSLFTDRYFEYSLRPTDISLLSFEKLIASMKSGGPTATEMFAHLYTHNADRLIRYVHEVVGSLDKDQTMNLTLALVDSTDQAAKSDDAATRSTRVLSAVDTVHRLIYGNVVRAGAAETEAKARFDLLCSILDRTRVLSFKVQLLGRYISERRSSSKEQELDLLDAALRGKLEEIADEAVPNLFGKDAANIELLQLWRKEDIFGFKAWFSQLVCSRPVMSLELVKTFRSTAEIDFHLHSWCDKEVFESALIDALSMMPEAESQYSFATKLARSYLQEFGGFSSSDA